MRKAAENNGYMTLKVELFQTKIARTIVGAKLYYEYDFGDSWEWAGLRTAESLKKYLDGEIVARKTP